MFQTTNQGRTMPRRLALRCLLSFALVTFALAHGAGRGAAADTLTVGGMARSYALALPEQLSAPVPLVLVLHGAGGNGAGALVHYRWDEKARAAGFIAAAPDAMPAFPELRTNFLTNPRYWSDGSGRGPPAHGRIDDTAFLAALIEALAARYPVDRSRIYVTGFSSGASMTHRAGLLLADRLAAIAPVAGKAWSRSRPARPLPVLFLVGDQDPLTPLGGGPVKSPWGGVQDYPPARALPEAWAGFDACDGAPTRESPQAGVALEAWRHCAGGAEVLFYTVRGLGHEWAGGRGRALPAAMTGPYTDAIDTTALIWDFFKRQRLRR
ncbi:MAG TPA: PHB depolymerase family esterase [Candidatus Sulfotelmatobacter sp.]|nr:PHB depolymerase family esterase [Candidatus Sulfotelmatobacter sp.]